MRLPEHRRYSMGVSCPIDGVPCNLIQFCYIPCCYILPAQGPRQPIEQQLQCVGQGIYSQKTSKNHRTATSLRLLLMSKRFINCTACKGCHTGRGGRYCPFISPTPARQTTGKAIMADPDAPEQDDWLCVLSDILAIP